MWAVRVWCGTGDTDVAVSLQNSLAACEFLLQNGANVNQADSNGRGPLHHATILGHTGYTLAYTHYKTYGLFNFNGI